MRLTTHGGADRRQQCFVIDGLAEIGPGAELNGPIMRLGRVVPGDDNDRHRRMTNGECALNVEPAHFRHMQIEHETVRLVLLDRKQELGTGRERLDSEAGR